MKIYLLNLKSFVPASTTELYLSEYIDKFASKVNGVTRTHHIILKSSERG